MSNNNENSKPNKEFCQSKSPLLSMKSQLSNNIRIQPDYLHFAPYGTSKPSSSLHNNNSSSKSKYSVCLEPKLISSIPSQDSASISISSAPLQSSSISTTPSFIHGTSNDSFIRLRLNVEDILRLDTTAWKILYTNPYQYFNTSQDNLLSISKKISLTPSSKSESFFNTTPTDGYCSIHSLYQLYIRESKATISLKQFVQNFSSISHSDNPDNQNITYIQQQHYLDVQSIDSQYWLGADNYHLYDFPFKFSLWTLNQLDDTYLGLAFTNQLTENERILTTHKININQIYSLATQANECHHSNQHFYIVPIQHQLKLEDIHRQVKEALQNMLPSIKLLLHELLQESPPEQPQKSTKQKQSNIKSFFQSQANQSNKQLLVSEICHKSATLSSQCNMVLVEDDHEHVCEHVDTKCMPMEPESELLMDFIEYDPPNRSNSSTHSVDPALPYDMLTLKTIITLDKFFTLKQSKVFLANQLEIGITVQPELYPSQPLRDQLAYLLPRTEIRPSLLANSGNGLFAVTPMQAGELVQTYGGSPQSINPYSMSVRAQPLHIIGGAPTADMWTKAGAINDYIWNSSMINCKRDSNGNIYTTRLIRKDEELYMSYGMDYNWDPVKQMYHTTLLDSIIEMLKLLPPLVVVPSIDKIILTYNQLRSLNHQGFAQLLNDFFSYDKGPKNNKSIIHNHDDQINFALHDQAPTLSANMSVEQWLECLIRSTWFYRSQCFRNHGDPNQKLNSPSLSTTGIPTRTSSRLSTKPIVSYINMDGNGYNQQCIMKYPPQQIQYQYLLDKPSLLVDTISFQTVGESLNPDIKSLYQTIQSTPQYSVLGKSSPDTSRSQTVGIKVSTYSDQPISESMDQLSSSIDLHNYANQSEILSLSNNTSNTNSTIRLSAPPLINVNTTTTTLDEVADNICPIKFKKTTSQSGIITLYINIGSNSELKRSEIYQLMTKHHADIVFITDCKVTTSNMASYKYHAKQRVASGTAIIFFPTQPNNDSNTLIGGTMVFISRRLKIKSTNQIIPLGALIQIQLEFEGLKITVLSLYHPRYNDELGSFASRIANLMNSTSKDIHSVIHEAIKTAIYAAQAALEQIILMGDLNENITLAGMTEFRYLTDELRMQHAATPRELQQYSYNMPSSNATHSSTRIDFTLYYGDTIKPISSTCIYHDLYIHDHVPLLTIFHAIGHIQGYHYPMFKPSKPSYDWSDIHTRNQYERLTSKMSSHDQSPSHERLDLISQDAVQLAISLKPLKSASRKKYNDDLCPINLALRITKKALILISRHVFGFKNYFKWSASNFSPKLKIILKQWSSDLSRIKTVNSLQSNLLSETKYIPSYWFDITIDELRSQIGHAIHDVNKLSTRKIKHQRKVDFQTYAAKRQYLYQIQKIGLPIQSILKSSKIGYDMSCIKDSEGKWISQPGRITEILRDTFEKWFAIEESIEIDDDQWLYDEACFLRETDRENIPRNIALKIWKAMQPPITNITQKERFQKAVVYTPSLTDYMNQVMKGSVHSAGGMSGLTYGMLRSLPQHVHNSIYQALADTWSSNSIPDSWKWRWLLPIPKVPEPNPSQLRPLCLLEVLRKLWSSLFVSRISTYMHNEKVLHAGQHAGKGKGTDSAVLEFASILETAREHRSQLYISSYDFKRAYDSIQHRFQTFSWVRSHVPRRVAAYLVEMDQNAYMTISTPLAQELYRQQGYQGLLQHEIAFQPEQGTAQGGVDSSLVFSAFLDILITAIANEEPSFYLSDIDGNLKATDPIGYVDDLIVAQGNHQDLQIIASLVSAFSILFKIQLNITKFRAFSINWGNHHDELADSMTIYTKGWIPTEVQLQHDGVIEHLGVKWDMSLHNVQMYEDITNKLRQSIKCILASKSSSEIKITTINVKLIPQILYQAKFAPWSMLQYQKLDTILNMAYRKIGCQRNSFPTALLYSSKQVLGSNHIRFSDQVQLAKLHLWQRSVYTNNERRQFVMNSMTARVLRQSGCIPARYGSYAYTNIESNIAKYDQQTWWFSSLAEHLHKHRVTISRRCISDAQIPLHFTPQQCLQLKHIKSGITTESEDHLPTDVQDQKLNMKSRISTTETFLRAGQVWMIYDWIMSQHEIIEIMGFINNKVAYLPWSLHEDGVTVTLSNSNRSMLGAGSQHMNDIDSIFLRPLAIYSLVTLTQERYTNEGNKSSISQIRIRTPIIANLRQQQVCHPWFADVSSDLLVHVDLTPIPQNIIEKLAVKSVKFTGNILIRKIDENQTPHVLIISNDSINHTSATSLHLYSLHVAAAYSTNKKQIIMSTSNIGIKYHRRAVMKPVAHPMVSLLVPHIAPRMFPLLALSLPQKSLLRSYSKYNKTTPNSLMIPHQLKDDALMNRLFISDVLNQSPVNFKKYHPKSSKTFINDTQLLVHLYHNPNGTLCYEETGLLFLEDYIQHTTRLLHESYLLQRDKYRQQVYINQQRYNENPNYWSTSSIKMAGDIFSKVPKGSSSSFVSRMCWDWHLTGLNACKSLNSIESATCELCGAPNENQPHIIWECMNSHMKATREVHLKNINDKLILEEKIKKSSLRKAIHTIIRNPRNYELILGRAHTHNQNDLLSLHKLTPKIDTNTIYNQLIQIITDYSCMAISLYRTRQKILESKNNHNIIIDHKRNLVISGEVLLGVSPHHHIHQSGTKVTKPIDSSTTTIIQSYKRKQLTADNSIYLKKQQIINQRLEDINLTRESKKQFKNISQEDQEQWDLLYLSASDAPSKEYLPPSSTNQLIDPVSTSQYIYNNNIKLIVSDNPSQSLIIDRSTHNLYPITTSTQNNHDSTNDSQINTNEISNNNNDCDNNNNNMNIESSSNISNSINSTHINNINNINTVHINNTSRKRNIDESSESYVTTVHNIHDINNINNIHNVPNSNNHQTYPIILPPQIVIVEDSGQRDKKRFRNQDLQTDSPHLSVSNAPSKNKNPSQSLIIDTSTHNLYPIPMQNNHDIRDNKSKIQQQVTSVPHYMWGSKWKNNSCAIDSITFGLSVLHHQSTTNERIAIESQLSTQQLVDSFQNITYSNLSKLSWIQATPAIRQHMFDRTRLNHVTENIMVDTDRIINLLFQQADMQKTTTTAWQYKFYYRCPNNHITIKTKFNRIVSICPPVANQSLEDAVTQFIQYTNKYCTITCGHHSCNSKVCKSSTIYSSPSIMFVMFVDLKFHPHIHTMIPNMIQIILQQQIHIYNLAGITYHNGFHFIHKARLNNGDIITYDGINNHGRAHIEPNNKEFPATFTFDGITWSAHTAWFQKFQSPNSTDPTNDSQINTNDISNNNNDCNNNNNNMNIDSSSNISNSINNTHINNINNINTEHINNTSRKRNIDESSESYVTTVHNIHDINNINNIHNVPNSNNHQTYPIILPPQIVIIEDSGQRDKKRFRNQDSTRTLPRKRTITEAAPQALTESSARRPRGLCSPGTAEGPTGQG